MKKVLIVLVGLLLLCTAYAEGHNEKTIGSTTVYFSIGDDSPVVGENHVTVELVDEKGGAITDAAVELYYFMPTMPAMNYTAKTELSDGSYSGVVKLVMPGPWDVDVRFKRPDEEMQKVTFSFEIKK